MEDEDALTVYTVQYCRSDQEEVERLSRVLTVNLASSCTSCPQHLAIVIFRDVKVDTVYCVLCTVYCTVRAATYMEAREVT
jgi:hypothetical protein